MRDYVLLYINGRRYEVAGPSALLSLSDYLRDSLGLIGTKIVCSEGDCGACSVLVGRPRDGTMSYHAVDACIQFIFQLDGAHVVTVDGLGSNGSISPVQQAMVDCHGSQCGFCTPGFVVTMTGMLEEKQRLAEADLRYGLTGNLCRCTGYTTIIEAGLRACQEETHQRIDRLYPPQKMMAEFASAQADTLNVVVARGGRQRQFSVPTNLDDAVCKVIHELKEVEGGTEYTLTSEGIPAGTKTEKQMKQGGEIITTTLKSCVERGKPTGMARFIMVMNKLFGFMTPKKCLSSNWPMDKRIELNNG